jgi:DNA-3-methyladenine glycosylase I
MTTVKQGATRCPWVGDDPLMITYHDKEWGKPIKQDQKIFEFLILESFQAGLSWRTVLHKRENFRKAFLGFEVEKVAKMGEKDVARLLKDEGIIRNRQKIEAAINNAKRFLEVKKEFGTFSNYMWTWVHREPIQHNLRSLKDYPAVIPEAIAWAKDLKKRGFSFLGPTTLYAHMQAAGMVNDHVSSCFISSSSSLR